MLGPESSAACAPSSRTAGQAISPSHRGQRGLEPLRVVVRVGQDLYVPSPVDAGHRRIGLFEHAMKVAAAKTEGAHRRAAGMVLSRAARGGPRC